MGVSGTSGPSLDVTSDTAWLSSRRGTISPGGLAAGSPLRDPSAMPAFCRSTGPRASARTVRWTAVPAPRRCIAAKCTRGALPHAAKSGSAGPLPASAKHHISTPAPAAQRPCGQQEVRRRAAPATSVARGGRAVRCSLAAAHARSRTLDMLSCSFRPLCLRAVLLRPAGWRPRCRSTRPSRAPCGKGSEMRPALPTAPDFSLSSPAIITPPPAKAGADRFVFG